MARHLLTKQTYRYRRPEFFDRLRSIPNVVFVNRSVDTYALLAQCQFAATISGTVGWEAITGGKQVVVFGRPWYLTLPGVNRWPVMVAAPTVAEAPVDHSQLQSAFNRLMRKSAEGLVDTNYQAALSDYSPDANTQRIADFLRREFAQVTVSLSISLAYMRPPWRRSNVAVVDCKRFGL